MADPGAVPVPHTVRVSARAKRIRLTMSARDGLVVVVPRRADLRLVPEVLRTHARWIERARSRVAARREHLLAASGPLPERIDVPVTGAAFAVALGRDDAGPGVRVVETRGSLELVGDVGDPAACREALRAWTTLCARRVLVPMLETAAGEVGSRPARVQIRAQRTRWGSASARGTISLNRNLVFLSAELVKLVAVTNKDSADQFRALMDGEVQMLSGPNCLTGLVQCDQVDTVLTAVVGAAGLPAVMAAAETGKRITVANKEPLVIAGELLTRAVREHGSTLLPIDSEHSAVFQALQSGRDSEIQRILLTGSGGPFRGATAEALQNVTLKQALSHPTWNMGPKITIDSATLMNKALEIIEARWLFDVPVEKIEVLIHPESIVHSLVEFVDGSVIAQLGNPDMCLPIQYALTYPRRVAGVSKRLRLEEVGELHFERPDPQTFRALPLAYEVARSGGTAAAAFNAANEAAVEEFLAGRIKFLQIMELVEHCLNRHDVRQITCLDELLEADAWARKEVKKRLLIANC